MSNANYNGSALDNCNISMVTVSAIYATCEAKFEARCPNERERRNTRLPTDHFVFEAIVNCSLLENLVVIATVETSVRTGVPMPDNDTYITSTTRDASLLIKAVSDDFWDGVLLTPPGCQKLASFIFAFQLDQNSTINWLSETALFSCGGIGPDPSREKTLDFVR